MRYDQRRKKRINTLKYAYTIAVTIVSLVAGYLIPDGVYQKIIEKLSSLWGWLAFIDPIAKWSGLEHNGLFYFGLAGLIVGVISSFLVIPKFYSRYLEEFDDTTFHPMTTAKPYDALWGADIGEERSYILPFLLSKDGQRSLAWEKLCSMIDNSLCISEQAKSDSEKDNSMFGWGILVGPSGAGKSRLAVELANGLRRETCLDDPTQKKTPPATRWKRTRAKLRSWWRVQVCRNPCDSDDPWDTGWLRPRSVSMPQDQPAPGTAKRAFSEHDSRASVEERLDSRLQNWRPRRPTFILLDDPREEDGSKTIKTFQKYANEYHHPVILLIVSPGVPTDLKIHKGNSTEPTSWTQEHFTGMLISPIDIGVHEPFSEREIRKAAAAALPSTKTIGKGLDDDIKQFKKKTTGHPFLVELGLLWTRQGHLLENISRDSLLAERVERIKYAFRQCGLDSENFCEAMVVATLAGSYTPVSRDRLALEYSENIFDTEKLCNLFPNEQRDNLLREIPPIRPRVVGESFVKTICRGLPESRLKRIAALAWKISPEGTLRSSLRLGFIEGDPLSEIIQEPPKDAGIDNVALTLAYAKTGVLLPFEATPGATRHRQAVGMTIKAQEYIAHLSDTEIDQVIETLITLPDGIASYQWFRSETWAEIMLTLLMRYVVGNNYSKDVFSDRFLAIWETVQKRIGKFHTIAYSTNNTFKINLLSCDIIRLIEILITQSFAIKNLGSCPTIQYYIATAIHDDERIYTTFKKSYFDNNMTTMESIIRSSAGINQPTILFETMNSYIDQCPLSRNRHLIHMIMITTFSFTITSITSDIEIQRMKSAIDAFSSNLLTANGTDKPRMKALPVFAESTEQDSTRAALNQLINISESIAAHFSDDSDFQKERAKIWRNYAWIAANNSDIALCKLAVDAVESIVAPFLQDRNFQEERATAWRHYAFAAAKNGDIPVCRLAVDAVEGIVAPFPQDRDSQEERATAWRHYTFAAAKNGDIPVCKLAVDAVERIAAPFPQDCDFQYERATAWQYYAFAAAKNEDSALCKLAVDAVERIVAPFPQDRDIQTEWARAWRHYAWAAAKNEDSALCKLAVDAVERIAAPFPQDRDFQRERAEAWRHYAWAAAKNGDIPVCRLAVDAVEGIAVRFPEDPDIKELRATARQIYAEATGKRDEPASEKFFAGFRKES